MKEPRQHTVRGHTLAPPAVLGCVPSKQSQSLGAHILCDSPCQHSEYNRIQLPTWGCKCWVKLCGYACYAHVERFFELVPVIHNQVVAVQFRV